MKGYKFGVQWIAENDDSGSPDAHDLNVIKGYISTLLLADLFEKSSDKVALDVLKFRNRDNKSNV